MEPNWDDLRIFLSLAREGTLTTAAKTLGVSHPTVARRVQALERQIGARLFDRLPDRFVPTAAGRSCWPTPRRWRRRPCRSTAQRRAQRHGERRGAALGRQAMAVLVARHLPGLRARLPHIEFEVIASHTRQPVAA